MVPCPLCVSIPVTGAYNMKDLENLYVQNAVLLKLGKYR